MIRLLERIFISKRPEKEKRQAYGILCGVVGILLNVCLFIGKFLAGVISNSIAITADAFNNLSDAGSSFVTLIGFKLAGAKPDPEHPFGHGRMEYVSGLVVAGAILIMAFELIRDSVGKIIHPQETAFSVTALAILAISILVKLYMAYYNKSIGRKINSTAMRATSLDSLSDACATTVVLVSAFISEIFHVRIDGWCGALVGLFIFYTGINAAKETLDPLLGQPPEKEFVEEVERLVMQEKTVRGIHDLVVHDYGPGRLMISLHAEVPADRNILELHDMIDNLEKQIGEKMSCEAVIHMDPVVVGNPLIEKLKRTEKGILAEIDSKLSLHDFRVVMGPTHTNLIFDVVIPFKYKLSDEELVGQLKSRTRELLGEKYFLVVKVDKASIK